MRRLFTLLLGILFHVCVQAQDQNLVPDEKLLVTTNADLLVVGETLYYNAAIYSTAGSPVLSKVAYVELIGSDRKVAFHHKLLVTANSSGDFKIPETLPTGNYKIIGYSSGMLMRSRIFEKNITIYNPASARTWSTAAIGSDQPTNNPQPVSLSTSKSGYSKRELVQLSIESLPKGQYTLSVSPRGLSSSSGEVAVAGGKPSVPEIRGEVISGTVTFNGNPSAGKIISLTIPDENYIFKVAQTDNSGRFYFTVERLSKSKEVFVQMAKDYGQGHVITLDQYQHPDYEKLNFEEASIPENLQQHLRDRVIAAQIENAYAHLKKPEPLTNSTVPEFFEPQGKIYNLDDFTRFPTLKETFIEVVTEVTMRESQGKVSLSVQDFNPGREISEPALVLVDGMQVLDLTKVRELPAYEVSTIKIVSGIYLFGPTAFNGIISIRTKTGNANVEDLSPFEIIRPENPKTYFDQKHDQATERLPDYRSQLLWVPGLTAERINFFTSDVSGDFEIRLDGISETGQAVSARKVIRVGDHQ